MPVTEKETRPVERVRLRKDVRTDEEQTLENVRREQVQLERENRPEASG